ncbi:VCBS domain-containing protein [Roseibium sp. SCP14]|uniref:VCBS domain-containing protein n=1 Tax=Roseibium sp. SCP14 TaxID=3141375 RepID=UPI00333A8DDF
MSLVIKGSGDDNIETGDKNDLIISGGGDDTIDAGDGNNIVVSGKGDDTVTSGDGDDLIVSGKGDDTIDAGDGDNVILAGKGDDNVTTGDGDDFVNAGTGDDTIDAGDGDNTVIAGKGDDTVTTGSGDDLVIAGSGDDEVSLGGGNDTAYLGAGNDTVNFTWSENTNSSSSYYGQSGCDTFRIILTEEQAQDPAILADLAAFEAHVASGSNSPFCFSSIDLVISDFEKIEIIAPVSAADDEAEAEEDGSAITIDVLSNDEDLLAPDNSALTVTGFDDSGIPAGASLTLNPDNTFSFDPGTAFQELAEGEQIEITFAYTVADDQGFEDVATVTITITGTNDAPTITSGTQPGLITEIADGAPGETVDSHDANGAVTFADVDLADMHSAGFVPQAGGYLGTFSLDPVDQGADSVGWNFSIDDADIDYLAAGETLVQSYDVTVDDGNGGTAMQTVTVTIMGTNDAPTITSGTQSGLITEIADGAPGENTDSHDANGAVTFADADLADTHSASFLPQAGGYLGTFSLDPVDQGADSVDWTFSIDDADIDYLAVGETLIQSYDVTVDDGNGGTAMQTVEITLTGTNDSPTITSGGQSGLITEIADGAAGENTDSHSANGTVTFADVDLADTHSAGFVPQAGGYLGTFSLDPVDQGADSVYWNFSIDDADIDYLAAGETLVQFYDVTVDDGNGGTAMQTVEITLTGTNDAPTITSGTQSGLITEIADGAAGENTDSHSANGTVTFADVDLADTHSAGFVPQAGGYLGTFSLDPVDQGADSVDWNFSIDDADIDYLAAGETLVQSYDVTVDDGNGGTAMQTVEITITGTNDAPTITSGTQSALITEIADGATGENTDSHGANGTVTFADVDLADTHSAGFVPQAGGYLGTFSLDPVDQGADSVGWSFSVDDADIDYLAAGETLVQSYDVAIDDGNGGTAIQTVEVTITGTNDAPTITSGTQSGLITEIADGATGENTDSHSANGAVTFADVDLNDTHSAGFVPQAGGYLGTFNLDPVNQGADSVSWSFSIDDADIDYLAAGETLIQSYDVTVDDGNGGTAMQTVEITITGTNDTPTITSGAQSGLVTEIADGAPGETVDSHSANGAVTFADVDLADTHSAGFVPQAGGYLGTFSLDPVDQGADSVGWNFSIDDADIDYLAAGETLVQSYDVTVDDGNGGTAVQTVEITITGTDDDPIVTDSIAATNSGQAISGMLTASDVDVADTLTFSLDTGPSNGTVTILPDGSYTYTPDAGFSGQDSFTFLVDDGSGTPVQGTVIVDIASVGAGQVRYVDDLFDDDEQVSSFGTSKDNPEVAALTGGGHIVVWSSSNQAPDGDSWGVFAQRYDANGDKIGGEFLVNTTTSNAQYDPSVAGISGGALDGGFVVVWQSPQDGSSYGIYAQRYDAGGNTVGGEILVNTTTSNNQIYPAVTALTGDKFAVTWTDQGGADGSGSGVFLKIFNADGTAASGEIQINQTTLNSQETEGWNAETITTLDDGGFVVSWASYDGSSSERWDAYMRIFNADGTARTGEMQVNTAATNTNYDQRHVSVGALQGTNAGFVVTWTDFNGTDGSGYGVFARIYDKDGNAVGSDFQVNTYVNSTQYLSKVEGLSDGSFVVVWQSHGVYGPNATISGQRFDAGGNKIGGEFIVPESSFSNETEPSIALRDDGALVVVWEADNHRIEQKIITDFATDVRDIDTIFDDGQVSSFGTSKDNPEVAALTDGGHIVVWSSLNQAPDSDNYGVFAQRYDANGDKIGGEFLVNTTTSNAQYDPSVAGISGGALDGGFVVVWQSYLQDGSGYGVYAQRYDAGGSAVGGEILVNTTTSSNQIYPTVTALADGKFAVTWTDQGGADSSGSGVFLKIFNVDGTAASGEIQVNQTTLNSQETEGWNAETITTLDDGGFVVSWASYDGSSSERWDAYIRVFNADGTARTGEFQVNTAATNTDNDQRYVSVGALQGTNAGFVVTWSDRINTDGSGYGVFARVYDKDGNAVGNDFQVNTYFYSTQYLSKVEGLSDGSFIVVWQSHGVNGPNATISGQRFDASGNKIGGEFVVPENSFSNEYEPSIALRDDGALVVVWKADNHRIEQKIITDFATDVRDIDTIVDDGQVSSFGTTKDNPEVAALTGGGHIVVWSSYNQAPDNDNYGVFAQRYDANGDKDGGEFLVNSTTSNTQFDPSVTGISGGILDGGFVVVWQSYLQDGSGYGVYAQRYDAGGSAVGGEILVNTTTSSHQIYPTVTALADGKFAVTWTDQGGADGSGSGVFLKIFNADGTAAGSETQVNQTTLNNQETEGWNAETITTLDDGGFVVSWASYDGNVASERWDAYMRIFNADGTARTGEMQVNTAATNTDNDQRYVSVGALQGTNAGFVVTWSDPNATDGSGWGVFARVYDKDGDAVGNDFQVNTYSHNAQQYSKVEALSDGSFVIVWQSYGLDGSNYTISGQRFDASGNKIGGEFVVPENSFSNEYEPSIALRDDGALVVAWVADNNRIEQKIITDFGTGSVAAKTITGTDGNDSLIGSNLDDTIDGAAGNDTIEGLQGNDFLTGGSGADRYVFNAGDGDDTITDFEVGVDGLVLMGGVTITGTSEENRSGDADLDTVVQLSSGDEIVLEDVNGITDPNDLQVV